MELGFPMCKGDKFQDDLGNVVTFLDYYSGTAFFDLNGVEYSMVWDNFYQQYMFGVIREVCDGPLVAEA
jgi:hypothetical protein